MSQYNEEHWGLLFVLTMLAGLGVGIFVGGFFGEKAGKAQMNRWALDNGYAHYDQRTGELILHDKE